MEAACHCDIINYLLSVTSEKRVVLTVTVHIDLHKCLANCRLENAELTIWLCVCLCDVLCVPLDTVYMDMWCTVCSPRHGVHGCIPYLSCFVYVNSVLFCFQITVTCARSILTNPKRRFILFTMTMLHTASVAKLAWMCTSWQTGRLFHATGARWGLMSHSVNR